LWKILLVSFSTCSSSAVTSAEYEYVGGEHAATKNICKLNQSATVCAEPAKCRFDFIRVLLAELVSIKRESI
jgi:hypothetical protein